MKRSTSFAFVSAALLALPAIAQDLPGDPVKGHQLARQICSECHYVDRNWADLYVFEAPSFVDVAQHSDHTEMSLRVFLVTPHDRMPNVILTRPEMDDVISWILSLRQEQ